MELLIVFAAILSIVTLIVFFQMAVNVKEIKNRMSNESSNYWLSEYNKARFGQDRERIKESLRLYVYYRIKQTNVPDKQAMHQKMKEKHTKAFADFGMTFPEWETSMFE